MTWLTAFGNDDHSLCIRGGGTGAFSVLDMSHEEQQKKVTSRTQKRKDNKTWLNPRSADDGAEQAIRRETAQCSDEHRKHERIGHKSRPAIRSRCLGAR